MLKTVKFSNRYLSFVAPYRTYLDYLYLYEPGRFADMVKIELGPGGVPCFGGFDRWSTIFKDKYNDVQWARGILKEAGL